MLQSKNVSFEYEDQHVLENISFQINKGEVFCLIGPNGCGKTTLLDCILGLLKPRKGEILFKGKNIQDFRTKDIAKEIAYVPQNHEKTFPYTVGDIVLMGRSAYAGLFNSPSIEDVVIVEEALDTLGLIKLKDKPYTKLSGGQGQLVMIARALAQRTPLIIMDEPTAHLDFKHELVILETIVRLVRDMGHSVIMATHFPNHALYFENNRVKTRVALMDNMGFSAVGSPREVLSENHLRRVYNINARVVSFNIDSTTTLQHIIPISTVIGTL